MRISVDYLHKQVLEITKRNKRVELDKAWETSWTRRGSITVFTYLTVGLFMSSIEVDRPWVQAIVPSVGFVLSTLSLPVIKNIWVKRNRNI